MVKETIIMNDKNNVIELSNIEIYEHCILDIETGEKKYSKGKKKIPHFTGLYFKEDTIFLLYIPQRMGL